jgi:hypothetical protein
MNYVERLRLDSDLRHQAIQGFAEFNLKTLFFAHRCSLPKCGIRKERKSSATEEPSPGRHTIWPGNPRRKTAHA